MISYETIQRWVAKREKLYTGLKKATARVAGLERWAVQPTSGGNGLALEGGTVVRALFMTMDKKL